MKSKLVNVAVSRSACGAFTLAELLVSIVVVVIIVLMGTQLMTSTTAVTRTSHKYIDTDTQARVVFDRMALDFAQMLKRIDIDYYVKQPTNYNGHGNGHGGGNGKNGDQGSDQIAFYSAVPGYYPSTYIVGQQSPISLVAYRVSESATTDPAYGRMVRMAKGLGWNAIKNNPNSNDPYPIVFTTGQIGSPNGNNCPGNSTTGPWALAGPTGWSGAICNDNKAASIDTDYEIIGPGVFRFEYYYLLKDGFVTDWPWDRRDDRFKNSQTSIYNPIPIGLSQVEAIGVAIAVIDPAGRKLLDALSPTRIIDLAGDLPDFKSAHGLGNQAKTIGDLENKWKGMVESTAQTGRSPSGLVIPAEAAKGIRIYSRYFDLKTL
jgi:hypothetical protein